MSALFTVIMPTYNRAYVIWQAIQSVVNQTETRWELLVVNDGSTDCTLRLIEEFRDPRIRVLNLEGNRGPSFARNRGLEEAQTPYVAYLDSDNTWRPNYLSTMVHAIDEHPECVFWACGQHTVFWERTREGVWTKVFEKGETREPITPEGMWRLKGVDTNCMVHRRAVADVVCGWDEQCWWLEDWDFSLRIFLAYPGRLIALPDILVDYRQVHGSGADGLAAEARENKIREIEGRRYLLKKWGDHPDFAAHEKLGLSESDLDLIRADK